MSKYRLVTREFGDALYAFSDSTGAGFTADIEEAFVFDDRDNKEIKLAFYRAATTLDFVVDEIK